jgi:hypothetical protein
MAGRPAVLRCCSCGVWVLYAYTPVALPVLSVAPLHLHATAIPGADLVSYPSVLECRASTALSACWWHAKALSCDDGCTPAPSCKSLQ